MAPLEDDGSFGATGLAVVGVSTIVLGVIAQAFNKLAKASNTINLTIKVSVEKAMLFWLILNIMLLTSALVFVTSDRML